MKRTIKTYGMALIAATLLISCGTGGSNQTETSSTAESSEKSALSADLTVDTAASVVSWAGTMVGIYTHEGTVDLTKADLLVENGEIVGGSFVVDMTSMVATDENYNPEEGSTPEKLIGHLSSPDFFDIENYPTASYKIKEVKGDTIIGDLTVRGITGEEKVTDVNISNDGESVVLTGDMVFQRRDYDVDWDHPVKDKVLKNEITVDIKLVAN